jgi:hypothetical protein
MALIGFGGPRHPANHEIPLAHRHPGHSLPSQIDATGPYGPILWPTPDGWRSYGECCPLSPAKINGDLVRSNWEPSGASEAF